MECSCISKWATLATFALRWVSLRSTLRVHVFVKCSTTYRLISEGSYWSDQRPPQRRSVKGHWSKSMPNITVVMRNIAVVILVIVVLVVVVVIIVFVSHISMDDSYTCRISDSFPSTERKCTRCRCMWSCTHIHQKGGEKYTFVRLSIELRSIE